MRDDEEQSSHSQFPGLTTETIYNYSLQREKK